MVTFLQKEYGECGKGFTFGKSMPISVWFDKDGMRLHYGQSARVPQAAILPWDEAEEFIRTMVQNGTYMNADEITQIKEVECKRVADSVLYFMKLPIRLIVAMRSLLRFITRKEMYPTLLKRLCILLSASSAEQ